MDEQPVQLLKETRTPIAVMKDSPKRVDYEYERAGTTAIVMFTEPLSGWRSVTVWNQRTKRDWVMEVASILSPSNDWTNIDLPIRRFFCIIELRLVHNTSTPNGSPL